MAHIGGVTGGVAASIAAAEKARQDREEEALVTYTVEELREEWEFKIVRSTFEAFRKPEKLQQVIAEEARAGWTLLEKFDNGRLRFKRPASARANDHTLPPGVDPYRTTFGMGSGAAVTVILNLTMVILGVVMLLGLGIILMLY